MPKKASIDLAQALKSIETGSQRINTLATQTSQRIVAFEEWLSQLPGKIATTYWYESNEDGSLGLGLSRDGQRWSLWHEVANYHSEETDYTRLRDAPVEIKVKMVSKFPAFLVHLAEAQTKLAEELEKTNSEFDDFAVTIGLAKTKEGA